MKVENSNNTVFRGRVGNMIYYTMNGQTYARRVSIPGKTPKRETEGHSPKQQESISRFSAVNRLYSDFRRHVKPQIWQQAAKLEGRRAHNLFCSTNSGCFNGSFNLIDFKHFAFSKGALQLPRNIQIEREGVKIRVTWEEERDLVSAASTDRLCVGVLYGDDPLLPCFTQGVTGVRGDLCGACTLEKLPGEGAHLYCFFARADGEAFSDCEYFRVEGE